MFRRLWLGRLRLSLRRVPGVGVDAHVVDHHQLLEDGSGVGVAGPVAADRAIQQDVERSVVHPLLARYIRGSALGVELSVHVEADLLRLPLDAESVEVVDTPYAIR